jgi:hypothetical protein
VSNPKTKIPSGLFFNPSSAAVGSIGNAGAESWQLGSDCSSLSRRPGSGRRTGSVRRAGRARRTQERIWVFFLSGGFARSPRKSSEETGLSKLETKG